MKSKIYLSERVPNKDRRFGAALEYYPVEIRTGDRRRFALFTPAQISEALLRGEANEEDRPPPTLWEKIRNWMRS